MSENPPASSSPDTPVSPKTPGFEALSFLAGNSGAESDMAIYGHMREPEEFEFELEGNRKDPHQYDPGVIRRMKKSGRYTLNNDVFEQKSRPVSVASLHEFTDGEGESKESKFNNVHKPVLFLKSCPSPHLHKQGAHHHGADPESLLGKLSLLDSIVQEMRSNTAECDMCGHNHHPTEQCLLLSPDFPQGDLTPPDLFSGQDTQIHCNPLFRDPHQPPPAEKKKKKKKRRKVFKFGEGKSKAAALSSDSD